MDSAASSSLDAMDYAFPLYDHCNVITGGAPTITEANNGSFYYLGTGNSTSHNRVSAIFDLSSMTFKKAISGALHNFNAFMYVAFKTPTGHVYEAGFRIMGDSSTSMKIDQYIKGSGSNYIWGSDSNNSLTSFLMTITNSVGRYNGALKVQLFCEQSGKIKAIFDNFATGAVHQIEMTGQSAITPTTNKAAFITVSLVPDKRTGGILDKRIVNDLRSGGYFKDVIIQNPFVYTPSAPTSGISFAPGASLCQSAYFYNDDCASRSVVSGKEKVSCFFDR
jgi:hypothetical protein